MASPSPPPPPLPGPSSELSSTLGASACAYPSCGTHSFLPTVCSCLLSFCPPHAFPPAAHACPVDPATRMMGRDNIASPDARGRFEQKFADLLPDRDRRVDRSAEERAREERRERAAVVLARHREAVALAVKGKHAQVQGEGEVAAAGVVCAVPARGVKPKLVPKKVLSPALELARLKAKAKAAEPRRVNVEVGERWYLNVIHCQGEVEVARTELWMHKRINCGRALDLFAIALKLDNVNGTSDDPEKLLTLAISGAPPVPARNLDRVDKVFTNGATAWVIRGIAVP